jgi:DNA-binding NtrC family response regulator
MRTALLRSMGQAVRPEHIDLAKGHRPEAASPQFSQSESDQAAGSWRHRLEEQEREALRATLRQAEGNLTRAASLFGLPRTTYRERLLKYGLLE